MEKPCSRTRPKRAAGRVRLLYGNIAPYCSEVRGAQHGLMIIVEARTAIVAHTRRVGRLVNPSGSPRPCR